MVIYYGGKIRALGTLNELLAKRDSVRITTPTLSPQTMQRVLEIIRHDAAADAVQVDNPRQNLENYYLEVGYPTPAPVRKHPAPFQAIALRLTCAAMLRIPQPTKKQFWNN